MKLLIVLSFFFVNSFISSSLLATNLDSLKSESNVSIHPLRKDRWSIMLKTGIDNDYNLSFLSNREISFKYQLSKGHAVRLDFTYAAKAQFSETYLAEDDARDYYGNSSAYRSDFEMTNQEYMYSGNLLYIDYKRTETPINFYYGAGLLAFVDSYMYDSENYRNSEIIGERGDIILETNRSIISFGSGISGLIGLEYFFTDFLSITTEYKTAIYYQHVVESKDISNYIYPTPQYNQPIVISNVEKAKFKNDYIRFLIPQFTLGLQFYF